MDAAICYYFVAFWDNIQTFLSNVTWEFSWMQQFNKNVIKNTNPAWYFVDDILPINWSKNLDTSWWQKETYNKNIIFNQYVKIYTLYTHVYSFEFITRNKFYPSYEFLS